MKTTLIRRAIAALVVAATTVAEAAVYHVTPDASSGSGSSWSDAATLAAALASAADGDTVLLKAGVYSLSAAVSVTKGVAVEGGYAGTDDTTLADEPLSILDAAGTTFTSVMTVTAATSGQTTALRRLAVRNGYACGISKSGAADLLVESCLIVSNGLSSAVAKPAAKGCYVEASGATVTFRDTTFRANRQENDVSGGSSLSALRVVSAKALVVEDCGFYGNCLLATAAPGYGEGSGNSIGDKFIAGSAIYTAAKTTVSGTRFSGNCANIRNSGSGGAIWFASGSSGSVVSNCLFAGNYDRASWYNNSSRGGAIVLSMGELSHTLDVVGSTFAYNLADGTACAGGITAYKGTLSIDGCVFAGNMINPYSTTKSRDLVVYANAKATVRNTVFDDKDGSSYVATPAKGGGLDMDDSVVFADPMLVTRPETITNLLVASNRNNAENRFLTFGTSASLYETLEAIDAHLMSAAGYVTNSDKSNWLTSGSHSPAIDLADASLGVGAETVSNGGRRNAGFYGGTAEASRSALNAVAMDDSAVTVTFDDATHPTATAAVSGSAVFNAFLSIELFTADPRTDAAAVANESATFSGLRAGDSRTLSGIRIYTPGATLYVRATATVPGLDPVVVVKEATVGGTSPAFVGHGGPSASVIHVRGGAAEKRDGTSWLDACATLEEALAIAAADETKTEIWIMGTATSTKQVTTAFAPAASTLAVRGGFVGTENSAEERPAEGLSYVDGQHVCNPCIIANAKGHDVVFERVAFMNAVMNGISKTGGGNLTVQGCHFLTNGLSAWSLYSWTGKDVDGRGIRVTSASGAKVVVTNCEFRMNLQKSDDGNVGSRPGAALCLSDCASAEVVDSRFHANGVWMYPNNYRATSGCALGDKSAKGSAIYTSVPTAVTRCEFSGNCNNIRGSWDAGGTVWFESGSSGSAVSNCLFKGNGDFGKWDVNATRAGAIVVKLGSTLQTLEVFGSTFAHNLADASYAAAGMTVYKGTVSLVNCVFGGGIVATSAPQPSTDLRVKNEGVVNASYTVFGGGDSTAVVCDDNGKFVQGTGVLFKDPLFVTTTNEVAALYYRNKTFTYFYSDKYAELEAIDAHLRSKVGYVTNGDKATWLTADASSPAIDAGTGDYENEPDFNGNCRNAGCYGNTAEASKSLKSTTAITFADVALSYPSGYSRPQVDFTVTGDEGVMVNASVSYKVGDGEWSEPVSVLGCVVGEKSSFLLPDFYARGTQIEFKFTGTSTAGDVVALDETESVESDLPAWYGHGGGARVLHVWSGALGDASGKDWNNACRTWREAVDLYNAESTDVDEIWIIDVGNPVAETTTLTTKGALAIRGGFSSMDDTADAREAGAVSTIFGDKEKGFAPFVLQNGHEVSVERVVFAQAPGRGFVKTGAGNLVITDCAFTNNARGAGAALEGAGLSVVGTANATTVTVSRCAFLDNGSTGTYNMGYGQGAYFKNCALVSLEDCVFDKNGRKSGTDAKDTSYGIALYAYSAPLTAKRCAFRSNHGTSRHDKADGNGGAVRIEGAAGATRFENCIFAGNTDVLGWDGEAGSCGGALVVKCNAANSVDLVNCTIAYNYADAKSAPGGLEVYSGTVTAVNCIFYGNLLGSNADAGVGTDVFVKSGASFTARYCLFTSLDGSSASAADGGTLSIDAATCLAVDPLFVTPFDDTLKANLKDQISKRDALAAIDVHLRGKKGYLDERTGEKVVWRGETSPAIDAGDPSISCANEAQPNGMRVNLGAYGNTAYATLSAGGFIFIVR